MRWISNRRQANAVVVVINQSSGLKLWYGEPHPGDMDWLHVSMTQCRIAFYSLYSQAHLSLEKSRLPISKFFSPEANSTIQGRRHTPNRLSLLCQWWLIFTVNWTVPRRNPSGCIYDGFLEISSLKRIPSSMMEAQPHGLGSHQAKHHPSLLPDSRHTVTNQLPLQLTSMTWWHRFHPSNNSLDLSQKGKMWYPLLLLVESLLTKMRKVTNTVTHWFKFFLGLTPNYVDLSLQGFRQEEKQAGTSC